MIFAENQRLINYRINEIIGETNRVSLINEEKAEEFKEKISKVEEYALNQAVEEKKEDEVNQLILHDDSKDILDTLDLIESEITIILE